MSDAPRDLPRPRGEAPRAAVVSRHERARLVALLTCRFGAEHLEAIEDALQGALLSALEGQASGPATNKSSVQNPAAWLYRVAERRLLDELRRRGRQARIDSARGEGAPGLEAVTEPAFSEEVGDEQLRMLVLCCDEGIPADSQLVLALKVLCGFSVGEIALRLFTSEANVYKRLNRARRRLREEPERLGDLSVDGVALRGRLPRVHRILYLLFTEGYLSSHSRLAIRRELCEEALRLAELLAGHPAGRSPETSALLALMQLHSARLDARDDGAGGLLLLEEQDRSRWDQAQVALGLRWLADSARGEVFSRYHAEAGIAAEHCLAASYAETRWERIESCYAILEELAPSALHRLNRAVAVAEVRGPAAALAILEGRAPPSWLAGSYLWAAVHADLYRRMGDADAHARYRDNALATAPSDVVRALLARRLGGIDIGGGEGAAG